MKKGDIVLVLFPFTNLVASKLRPALVLGKVNKGKDYIVCGITSIKNGEFISIGKVDLSSGDLPKISYIKYEKVVTLDKRIFKGVVATLKTEKYKQVASKICTIIR
jgi:mRNA interferase MazF